MLADALVERLREVLEEPVTEAELRARAEQADALVRIARGRIYATERRLDELTRDEATPLAEVAAELQRGEALRVELAEAESLQSALVERAHELRSGWFRQA